MVVRCLVGDSLGGTVAPCAVEFGVTSRALTMIERSASLGIMTHLPSVEVSYGKDTALASSSG